MGQINTHYLKKGTRVSFEGGTRGEILEANDAFLVVDVDTHDSRYREVLVVPWAHSRPMRIISHSDFDAKKKEKHGDT